MANITCTVCPMGCSLIVNKLEEGYKVEGNTCKRGEKYGVEELTNPKRVITSTVKLNYSYLNLLPVKTSDSIPKSMMFEVMNILDHVEINAPVKVGEVIIKNVLGTGVDIISAKNMEKIKHIEKLKNCI